MSLFRKLVGIFQSAGVALRKRLLSGLPPVFVEDVFSTYLYTGNSTARSITNNIDLSTKGGLTWIKNRTSASYPHMLYDTIRGVTKSLSTDSTVAEQTYAGSLTAFNTTGFSLGTDTVSGNVNNSGENYASWTFRKQPKFFDVVTYTGNSTAGRQIAHNLGSVPGCIFVKQTNVSGENWDVYHRSLANNKQLYLNATDAELTTSSWNSTTPTSTVFTVGDGSSINASGSTYVAYLFAHDAGGFGLTGADNVISCGSLTTNGSGVSTVNLGYEPQWVLLKAYAGTSPTSQWIMFDNMRGWTDPANNARLFANLSNAETSGDGQAYPTATGFGSAGLAASTSYIYIAIRRGPMAVPTVGTSVYNGITRTGTAANATVTGAGFPVDLLFSGSRNAAFGTIGFDRLRGATQRLFTHASSAEAARATSLTSFAVQDGYTVGDDSTDGGVNNSGQTYIYWNFRRAPSFFDEVCYTGTGVARTVTHNLGVVPELMIVKRRSAVANWVVYSANLGNATQLVLDSANASSGSTAWNSTTPTSTVFSIGTGGTVNSSGITYVAYLFATCAGVSKVGRYSGTGNELTIDCGFTSGARFVLIKQDNSDSRNWYVFDSARGITSSVDPFLWLSSTNAEDTLANDIIDTVSTGFKLTSSAPSGLNAASGTYIFLAIA
jgi:hypothetical protein